ncbi:MAG: helix-turn-helix transcriptional regulator, partial [Lachnospiraceae bacterium]|nr:helix-turn-helix transcriptional regulator [Lachnospiraceae bacterium]
MYEDHQYNEKFGTRLTQLRTVKGVSAREMSLAIGQNPAYINNIETGKSLPSMNGFFYICEYLEITPMHFFETNLIHPAQIERILGYMKQLNSEQLEHI